MISSKSSTDSRDEGFGVYLTLSLFAHIIIAIVLLSSKPPPLEVPSVISVSIEPNSSLAPKEQIVSPPSQRAEEPPPETSKISDIDSKAVIEQVKRGEPGAKQPSTQLQRTMEKVQRSTEDRPTNQEEKRGVKPANQKAPEQQERTEASKAGEQKRTSKVDRTAALSTSSTSESRDHLLKNLTLDDSTLTQKFAKNRAEEPARSSSNQGSTADLNQYRAFSRPEGSGASFIGSAGVSDHLPTLPDGDITLLNAKANTYAGFVRRVAVQVFGQLKSKGWERLSASELKALSDFATVEAVMSPQGELIRTVIISGSGSTSFDTVVNQSAAAGTRDPNPPPGARASDGLIHFVFKARSWSQVGVNARNGLPSERRWLLLATGLE